jgi:hypothetical protein
MDLRLGDIVFTEVALKIPLAGARGSVSGCKRRTLILSRDRKEAVVTNAGATGLEPIFIIGGERTAHGQFGSIRRRERRSGRISSPSFLRRVFAVLWAG